MPGDHGAHGDFDADANRSSPFTEAAMRFLALGDIATGALRSVAGILGR